MVFLIESIFESYKNRSRTELKLNTGAYTAVALALLESGASSDENSVSKLLCRFVYRCKSSRIRSLVTRFESNLV